MENIFDKLNALYGSIEAHIRCKNIIMDAKTYLKQIPQMDYVFAALPYNLSYTIESGLSGQFRSNGWFNQIAVSPIFASNSYYKDVETKLELIITLSHELCHANQHECGLTEYNLRNASFSDMFRVSKMTEMEAVLLDAVVENELVKRPEFDDIESVTQEGCLYHYYLDKEDGNVQKAKRDFVLSCWTNSYNNIQTSDAWLKKNCQEFIKDWYWYYTKAAFKVAASVYKPKPCITPIQAIDTCLQRMGLNGVIRPEFFLQNGSDNTKTDNKKCTITMLNQKGEKQCKYYMKSDEIKVIMFKNKKAITL